MGGLRQHSDPRKTVLQAPMWTRRASCSWRKLRGFPGQGTKVWCLPYGREPTGVTTFSPDLRESLLSLVRPVTLTGAQRTWCKAFPGHCQQSAWGTRSHGLRKDVNTQHAGRPARLPHLFQAPGNRSTQPKGQTGPWSHSLPTVGSLRLREKLQDCRWGWGTQGPAPRASAKTRMTAHTRITHVGRTGLRAGCLLGGNLLSRVL